MKQYNVGVFPEQGKNNVKYTAYTKMYNNNWWDCIEVPVFAESGVEAKKFAIRAVKTFDIYKKRVQQILKGRKK